MISIRIHIFLFIFHNIKKLTIDDMIQKSRKRYAIQLQVNNYVYENRGLILSFSRGTLTILREGKDSSKNKTIKINE